MAIAAVATATMAARPASNLFLTPHRARWVFTPFAVSSSSSSKPSRVFILYSKFGCCLCDGLKEKLQAAFLLSGPDSLHDVDLQVRDITSNPEWERAYQYEIPVLARVLSDGTEVRDIMSNPEWERAYQYEIPVLARVLSDGTEETLPRLSPRLGMELVQKKIAAAFKH